MYIPQEMFHPRFVRGSREISPVSSLYREATDSQEMFHYYIGARNIDRRENRALSLSISSLSLYMTHDATLLHKTKLHASVWV